MPGLSAEGRFQLAYDAALDLATIAILAAGYRLKTRTGHHQLTFEAAGIALGSQAKKMVDYLDVCRRKRNVISYEGDEIDDRLADELVTEVGTFLNLVESWLKTTRPDLV